MRIRDFGKSILAASIPGALLPLVFWSLFSVNTTATGKDIFPPLNNPLEIGGCAGSFLFGSSVFVIFVTLASITRTIHQYGLILPIYDMLSSQTQSNFLIIVSFAINVLLWAIPITFYRLYKQKRLSSAASNQTQ